MKEAPRARPGVLWILFGSSSVLTVFFSFHAIRDSGCLYFENLLSPFIVTGALSFYKIFSQTDMRENLLTRISPYTFGIYLVHMIFIVILNHIPFPAFHPALIIAVRFAATFGLSLGFSWMAGKNKILKRII